MTWNADTYLRSSGQFKYKQYHCRSLHADVSNRTDTYVITIHLPNDKTGSRMLLLANRPASITFFASIKSAFSALSTYRAVPRSSLFINHRRIRPVGFWESHIKKSQKEDNRKQVHAYIHWREGIYARWSPAYITSQSRAHDIIKTHAKDLAICCFCAILNNLNASGTRRSQTEIKTNATKAPEGPISTKPWDLLIII